VRLWRESTENGRATNSQLLIADFFQVLNAQNAGYSALIVFDDTEEDLIEMASSGEMALDDEEPSSLLTVYLLRNQHSHPFRICVSIDRLRFNSLSIVRASTRLHFIPVILSLV
jgi:hypothetical protein